MAVPLLLRDIRGAGGRDLNWPWSGPEDRIEHLAQRPPILFLEPSELAQDEPLLDGREQRLEDGWLEEPGARDAAGKPTGVRIDGPHNPAKHPDPRAQAPHGHVPGVTNLYGTPWLPIKD